ncbi:MAG: hypothetical protein SGARI_005041, partial [Bacillariaceae sp.]
MQSSDRLEIRYNILSAEDLMAELEGLEETTNENESEDDTLRQKYIEGLPALAKKYNRRNTTTTTIQTASKELPLWCQQIAFAALRRFPDDPPIVAGAVSLNMLEQAKSTDDEEQELQLAECLRKGCLLLGAVCHNDNERDNTLGLALMIVNDHDGLEFILEILN